MSRGSWARDLIDLLLPAGCVSCGGWIPMGGATRPELVCAACRMRMRAGAWPRCPRCHWPRGTGRTADMACRECEGWPETITAARFAYELAPPATDLVHGLKYEGWRELAIYMGDVMARLDDGGPPTERSTVVVPVPTTRRRLRTRGYNQAELLARRVAEVRELPMVAALERVGATGSQTTLT
ncbi:MAG: double zinc ribbon domain-containing protein, partial [Thioalkalivibrio sp.]|nr:double zinc ribbon domain-containing protein [Thioalkalivibrio sp.]